MIVQNFRAKPATAMLDAADLETRSTLAAVAVTRIVLGPDLRVQAPPNLTDERELALLVRAGIDDWGGVSPLTPDHVNPERPWPQIDELARLTAATGFELRERLTTHPHYLREARDQGSEWVDDRLLPRVLAMADNYGLARDDARLGRFPASAPGLTGLRKGPLGRLLARAADDPAGLPDADYVELLHADGDDLDALTALADELRRAAVGDAVTYAVNRNLDSGLGLAPERITELAAEAIALGATEICAQGAVPGDPGGYAAFARAVKAAAGPGRVSPPGAVASGVRCVRRQGAGGSEPGRLVTDGNAAGVRAGRRAVGDRAGRPALHLHAFRPGEHLAGAAAAGSPLPEWFARLREAGVDTVPGTGARILDDDIRAALTAGSDIAAADWIATITAAHRAGLRSTATMVYGHVESAADQVRHLRALAAIQDETGGFTELIAMPWLPIESPVPVAGARPGPSVRESRAVHAVARLMLHGRIDHVQAAWTKLGLRGAQLVLASGADDLGGVLLDGELDPAAGPEAGRQLTVADVTALAASLGRPVRQRTTTYGEVW